MSDYFRFSPSPPALSEREKDDPDERLWRKETRVTSAITISHIRAWVESKIAPPGLQEFFATSIPEGYQLSTTLDYAKHLYNATFSSSLRYSLPIERIVLTAARIALDVQCRSWAGVLLNLDLDRILNHQFLNHVNYVRTHWDRLVRDMSSQHSSIQVFRCAPLQLEVTAYEDICVIKFANGGVCVVPWLAIVAFQDSLTGMFDVLTYTLVDDAVRHVARTPLVEEFCKAAIKSHCLLGAPTYDVLKAAHAILVGEVLRLCETVYTNNLKEETLADLPDCPLKTLLSREYLTEDDVQTAYGMGGLAKVFTYPVVDIDKSVENVVSKSLIFDADEKAGRKALNMFRKNVCRTHVFKHGCWPPLTIKAGLPGMIQEAISRGVWSEDPRDPWDSSLFEYIEIGKFLEFDWQVDPTSLLSDKAISVTLQSWCREYDTRYHHLLYNRWCKPGPPQEKRLLIEYIKRLCVDVKETIIKFIRYDTPEDHVSVMCLKERELNREKGRPFTKNTLPARVYQVTCENNMKKVLSYCPITTMTASGDALTKMLLTKSANLATAKVSVDFSKWCQYQRLGLIGPIAQQIDKMFDVSPVYESVHILCLTHWFLFQDSANIPEQAPGGEPVSGPRAFPGLATFGEGMFQKLWTLVTGCGLLEALEHTGYDVSIFGSGDNQVIVCDPPKGAKPEHVQANLLRALNDFSTEARLKIKLMETFTSSVYLEYAKMSFLKGKRIDSDIKRASRIGTESQENVPSINTKISGICATGIATASAAASPIAAYAVSAIEVVRNLQARGMSTSPERFAALLMLNRQAGGFKVSLYPSFCMRGIDDHLPTVVAMWDYVRRDPSLGKLWRAFETLPLNVGKADWRQIAKDPYSLPCVRAPDADSGIVTEVQEALSLECRNIQLGRLLNSNAENQEQALVATLARIKPLSPKLMSYLYELSNVALRDKLVAMFQSSSSILKLIGRHKSFSRIVAEAQERDKALMDHLSSAVNQSSVRSVQGIVKQVAVTGCPTLACDNFRRQLTGQALINPSQPSLLHQFIIKRWEEISEAEVPYAIQVEVAKGVERYLFERGTLPSYLGSNTVVKRVQSTVILVNPDDQERSAMTLGELKSWITVDPHLDELINVLIREKTLTPVEVVQEAASQIAGGTFEHRAQTALSSRGVHINFNPAIMSYLDLNTDTATHFAKQGGDFTILFQGVKIRIASYLLHRLICGEDIVGTWAAILSCGTCTREIYNGQFVLEGGPSQYRGLPLGSEHHLTFTPKGRVYTDLTEGSAGAREAGHVYIAEKLVTAALNHDHIGNTFEVQGVGRAEDFTVTSNVSRTDLSRISIPLLILCVIQRLLLRPQLYNALIEIGFRPAATNLTPATAIMDPIVVSGRARDLLAMDPVSDPEALDSREGRVALLARVLVRKRFRAVASWGWCLATDSLETRRNICSMKADAIGDELAGHRIRELTEGELVVREEKLGIKVLPTPLACQRAIRGYIQPENPKCQLHRGKLGFMTTPDLAEPLRKGRYRNDSTSYGLTVYASQVWSILQVLPKYPVWAIRDKGGNIGVVAGHRGQSPAFIHDPMYQKRRTMRINNGPIALNKDQCHASYERNYYIRYLGSLTPGRPMGQKQLIIVVPNIRGNIIPWIKGQMKAGDIVVSRYREVEIAPHVIVGFPRRRADDVWYTNYVPPSCTDELESDPHNVPNHDPSFVVCRDTTLSPHSRACKLLGLRPSVDSTTVKEELSTAIETELVAHLERLGSKMSTTAELIEHLSSASRKKTGKPRVIEQSGDTLLMLLWLEMRAAGHRTYTMEYHLTTNGVPHPQWKGCGCDAVEEDCDLEGREVKEPPIRQKYRPRDELMAYYLSGININAVEGDTFEEAREAEMFLSDLFNQ